MRWFPPRALRRRRQCRSDLTTANHRQPRENNRDYVGETVRIAHGVSREMQSALFDPQTAGGLLISLTEENAARFLDEIPDAIIIGRVKAKEEYLIEVS